MAVSAAVKKKYYDEEVPPEFKKYTARYHYTWCVEYAIAFAEAWRSQDLPGLQRADGIAWACNRYAINRIDRIRIPHRAEDSWNYFGGPEGPNGWLKAFHFTRQALRNFVSKEQADGRTLARFRRWEQEDSQEKN